jgi:hypothetical protein
VTRALAALLAFSCATAAGAAERRFAVLIGSNEGAAELRPLRFAEQDAAKLGAVLTELGGVAAEDLLMLKGPSLAAVRASFDDVQRRIATAGGRTFLMVFFSGHSDGVALELGGERLTFSELKHLMEATGADVRLAVVDSCRSGSLLAAKGGAPGPAFDLRLAEESFTGTVLLTSSAADEQALESREIGGSFFTHYLVSGLRGAADANGDRRVTLTEAYDYAYARTVRTTADTLAGPQHPAFEYRLSGRGGVVLTDLSAMTAALVLPDGFERALAIDRRRDQVVAEVGSAGARRIALAPGDYEVRAWRSGSPLSARVHLAAGDELRLDRATFAPAGALTVARKGPLDDAAPPLRNSLTFDPVFLAVQTLSLHYQRALGEGWSVTAKLRAGLLPQESPMLKLLGGGPGTSVLGAALGASWYPAGDAPRGFFIGPAVDLFRVARGGAPAAVLVPSVELGYAWALFNGFYCGLAGGAQYAAVVGGRLTDGDAQLGLFPRAAVRLGYGW